jgi:hypothetical protein
MQPYLFPYVGYFQLVAAVDKFVFYDDVNYIKNGWINRNRLLRDEEAHYFTVPLSGASPFQKIKQVRVHQDGTWRRKMLESVRHSYSKAPEFEAINALLCTTLQSTAMNISDLASQSVVSVSRYLGLETQFVMSSSSYGNEDLHGVDRILDICAKENASEYHNLPGGRELYESSVFEKHGVNLRFVDTALCTYKQFSENFHPGLSILDVLMFNDRGTARNMLCTEARP